jgi:predicted peroxiredoxin
MPNQYAVLLNASTDDVGPAANGLEYALDLDEGGNDVEVYLDGAATKWADKLEAKPEHPVAENFEEAEERGLIAGACAHCTEAFGATEGIDARGIDKVGEGSGHGPDISELAETHELLTVG